MSLSVRERSPLPKELCDRAYPRWKGLPQKGVAPCPWSCHWGWAIISQDCYVESGDRTISFTQVLNCVNLDQKALLWVLFLAIHGEESRETVPVPSTSREFMCCNTMYLLLKTHQLR